MIATDPDPNEVARDLIGRDYLSYSSINCYRSCPLQFFFRYVERLPEETVSSSLVFGSAIHASLEYHFEQQLAGNPSPDLNTLLAVYQEVWNRENTRTIRFGGTEDVNTSGGLAERMLVAFTESDLARPPGHIVGIEEELRGNFDPECPDLLARVDLMVADDEALVVRDFKTARSRWSSGQLDESADQLLLYHELAKPLSCGKPLRLEFAVMTKTKDPAVQVNRVEANPQRLVRIRRTVQQVWQSICTGHFYPAPSPLVCSGCPFQEPCRAWNG